jgi:hypothetical protein
VTVDIKKIAAAKKMRRDSTAQPEFRQAIALEEIADNLEAMRTEATVMYSELVAAVRALQSKR